MRKMSGFMHFLLWKTWRAPKCQDGQLTVGRLLYHPALRMNALIFPPTSCPEI